ncbi:hypothetical protein L484_003943 [Morus notabilis]|uniref:Uncharacterized protein n=1 Tax=Morus notabilis TaxID=981085 RepID=W9QW62_9ROSA|nr:hypothetical protein L484_003943 [Morus notabilis]
MGKSLPKDLNLRCQTGENILTDDKLDFALTTTSPDTSVGGGQPWEKGRDSAVLVLARSEDMASVEEKRDGVLPLKGEFDTTI